jgi:hypothetical protein
MARNVGIRAVIKHYLPKWSKVECSGGDAIEDIDTHDLDSLFERYRL